MASSTTQRLLAVLLGVLLVGIAIVLVTGQRGAATRSANSSSPFDGPTMPPNLRAADFSLVDQNGHRVSLSEYRGKVIILTFIHSLCHDTCPFMVEQIKGALNELPGEGPGVPAIGVSVAPAEDTVARRRAFLAKHELTGRLAFVNGGISAMRHVWHAYAIEPVTPKIDHSTFVLLIDRRGFERVGFAADQLTPEGLSHDIRVLEREPA
ncbi:MAG: SCO family protein [Solirubrobacteraceae bacterium]